MKWKRCSKCQDLKPVDRFWRKGNGYQSKCIDCMKKEYQENKEKKKEYDRLRYEKAKRKKEENEEEYVCMRCDEFVANVRNNQLYWCFHCLFIYEKEWKQKIKVEVINPVIRRSKFFKEKIAHVEEETKEKKMEELLRRFVFKLEDENKLDENLKNAIMNLATVNDKEDVMEELLRKVEIHRSYDDEKGLQFPYRGFISHFIDT